MKKLFYMFIPLLSLSACTSASHVMDMGDGQYMLSTHANYMGGGATEAND